MSVPTLGFDDGMIGVVRASPIRRDVLVAEGFERGRIDSLLMLRLHLQEQLRLPRTGDMEGKVAVLVAALDARAHLLLADVTVQFPPTFRYLIDIRDGFHERHIGDGDFWYPNRTE